MALLAAVLAGIAVAGIGVVILMVGEVIDLLNGTSRDEERQRLRRRLTRRE